MPAAPHPSFHPPKDHNAPIWRYATFPAFLQMLRTKALHLTRIDRFHGDPHDGSFVEFFDGLDVNRIIQRSKAAGKPLPGPHKSEYPDEIRARLRQSFAVNCWCVNDVERMSLWERYGSPFGVAIRSTYQRLCGALSSTGPDVFVGRVNYGSARAPGEVINLLDHALQKRRAFEDEQEIRVVFWSATSLNQPKIELSGRDGLPSCPPEGVDIPVDLNELIVEVLVGPPWQSWFHTLVADVAEEHGLDRATVRRSRLMDPPVATIAGSP